MVMTAQPNHHDKYHFPALWSAAPLGPLPWLAPLPGKLLLPAFSRQVPVSRGQKLPLQVSPNCLPTNPLLALGSHMRASSAVLSSSPTEAFLSLTALHPVLPSELKGARASPHHHPRTSAVSGPWQVFCRVP